MSHQFKLKSKWWLVPIFGMGVAQPVLAATNLSMANQPLAGVTQAFPANVYLALSVEFPTAGAAYNVQKNGANVLNADSDLQVEYLGYFDPKKCYVLKDGSYFEPVAFSTTDSSGRKGMCNSGSVTNQYSGNALNWATMTALDVYRSAMTGGNRALGTAKTAVAYQNGDAVSFTSLRRANVVSGQNKTYRLTDRRLTFRKDVLNKLVPHSLLRSNAANSDVLTVTFNNDTFSTGIVYQSSGTSTQTLNVPVVIQVCKPGYLESNCTAYGSSAKPEGLMQQNVKKLNFSALGYLNISGGSTSRSGGSQISGGVVRSSLGSIRSEYNTSTGQYVVNPFPQTGVNNSGSINYLNKFGDANGYKTNDPVAELYYTALRYIRGMGYVDNVNWMPSNLTNGEKDDFPVVDITGKDPFKLNSNPNAAWDMEKVCSKNTIMLIGDTNSHADGHLPNLNDSGGFRPTDDPALDTQEYINKMKAAELTYIGAPANSTFMNGYFDRNGNTGSSASPGGLPGMAYWANTQNVRPDVVGRKITVQTFAIDVLENTDYKTRTDNGYSWVRNAYYMAGKYGGFVDKNNDGMPSRSDPTEWTDDTVAANGSVTSSISQFPWGKPRNYALANNPSSMVTALEQAFSQVASAEGASQTGVATSVGADLFDIDNDRVVRASYKDSNWSGDVVGFQLRQGSSGALEEDEATSWSVNTLLKTNTNRRIYANNGTAVYEFTVANAGQFNTQLNASNAANLIDYMRGGTSNEGNAEGKLRPRSGDKLGSVVNSQVVSITTPKNAPVGCTYNSANALTRDGMYGFAANDGMYHLLDANGNEIYAYLPSTSLSKLNAYATNDYAHQYINDGVSTHAEVCMAAGDGNARSVVVGSAGRGGRSIYALDVTNPTALGAGTALWEFNHTDDSDFGYFIGKPVMTKDTSGKAVVVVTSGYNGGSNDGYLYVLDVNKTGDWTEGVNYKKIALGTGGVGSPFVYDADNDGVADAVYMGDLDGKLWKVNATSGGNWEKAFAGQPLFSVPGANASNPGTGITATPFVQVTRGRLTVFFGTGRYFSESDFDVTAQNHAYGIFDTGVAITNASTQILNQTISDDPVGGRNDLWLLSSNALQDNHLGWKITLRPGQMIVDQANVQSKRAVFFNVFTPMPASNCLVKSETFLLGADVRSGAQYEEPLFDVNGDGVVDNNDAVGGFYQLGEMLGPVGTMVQTDDGRVLYIVIGSDGKLHVLDLNPLNLPPSSLQYKRLSWREIF